MFLIDVPIAAFLEQRRSPSESQIQEAAAKARAVIDEAATALKAGEPFQEVAKRLSRGANTDQGGAWGFIEQPLKGRWETPSKKLFELKEGETSEILEAAKSFFIVKVGKVEERQITDFNESQPQIANTLKQRRFNKLRADFLQDELKKSTIGSLDEFVAEVLRAVPDPKTSGR
jgi:parvulin-like peptidyl-prolyl isomerase